MIISADQLPGGCELSADLAVVGGGPAGIVSALEAARNGFDVLLIESGGTSFDAGVQQLSDAAEVDPGTHAPMSVSVRRQLGGASALWGGRCVPFDPVDFDQRPSVCDTAWPISYEQVLPYFQRACDWFRCGRAVFDTAGMPHLPAALVPGPQDAEASTATLERWSPPVDFARDYGGDLRRSARVRVVTGLTCVEIISDDGGISAARLTCRTLSGKQVPVRARGYVLAGGGLETTRLLLASRGPDGSPPGGRSGHLGRWYMAHVDGVIANARFSTPPRATVFGYERDIDGTRVRRRFSISREAQLAHELPNAIAFLANPPLADPRHRNGVLSLAYLALRSPLGRHAMTDADQYSLPGAMFPGARDSTLAGPLRPHLANVARDLVPAAQFAASFGARRILSHRRRAPGFFTAYSAENRYPLRYHAEQIPDSGSRVSLTGERDALGLPRLRIDLRFSKHDVDGIVRCHQLWDAYLRRTRRGQLEYTSSDPASAAWDQLGGGGCHQLGTTRMAARASDGVVDEHLAVHGMRNLFVASSSVFLTSSQANPTFMVVVLALKLADRLKSVLPGLTPAGQPRGTPASPVPTRADPA